MRENAQTSGLRCDTTQCKVPCSHCAMPHRSRHFFESDSVLGPVIGRLCAFLSLLLLVMRSFAEGNPPVYVRAIASHGKNNNRKLLLVSPNFAEVLFLFRQERGP